MIIANKGLDIIKKFESLRLKPYYCPAGIPTIGYGSTFYEDGRKVSINDESITKERALELLQNTANKFSLQVSSSLRAEVNQNQFDALISFAFNVGIGNFLNSTLLRKVNVKDFEGASMEFPRWNRSKGVILNGLIKRRKEEQNLFLGLK